MSIIPLISGALAEKVPRVQWNIADSGGLRYLPYWASSSSAALNSFNLKMKKKHPLRIDNNHYLSSICSNKYTVNLRSSIERVLCSNTMLCYMVKQIVNVSHFRLTLLDVAIKGVYKEDRYVIWKDVYEMYWMTHRFIHVMGRFSIKLKGKPCL